MRRTKKVPARRAKLPLSAANRKLLEDLRWELATRSHDVERDHPEYQRLWRLVKRIDRALKARACISL